MEYLTVAEVAKRLRLHEMTVRRHIKSGRIRAHYAGRRIRIPESEVEAFVTAGGRHGGTSAKDGKEWVIREPAPTYDAAPTKLESEMSPDELKAWIMRERKPEELARIRAAFDQMRKLRAESNPLGMSTATLVRVSRRMNEVAYGEKTFEELVAEES
jgi:excisionase family DNA binding protein